MNKISRKFNNHTKKYTNEYDENKLNKKMLNFNIINIIKLIIKKYFSCMLFIKNKC